ERTTFDREPRGNADVDRRRPYPGGAAVGGRPALSAAGVREVGAAVSRRHALPRRPPLALGIQLRLISPQAQLQLEILQLFQAADLSNGRLQLRNIVRGLDPLHEF